MLFGKGSSISICYLHLTFSPLFPLSLPLLPVSLPKAPKSQDSTLLDLLSGSPPATSAAPSAVPSAAPASGGGALLDLLNLDIQQPAPTQPSTGGGGDLGAGLLDLLSAPTPASG